VEGVAASWGFSEAAIGGVHAFRGMADRAERSP
jgi:hypothetical protein